MNQYDVRLKVRQDTEANWVLNDPILSLGEFAISYSLVDSDYTVESLKIGKGKKWSETDIYKSNSEIETYIFNKIGDTDTINMYYDTNDGLYKLDFVGTLSYNDLSNKPTLFSGSYSDLSNKPALFSGSYTDLSNKPTIPAAQIQSDWTQATTGALDYIKNKPTTITTDVASGQQTLLANTANWSTPTASSISYYIGSTALSGNKQGQFYFDGLYFFFFIADDYPIRLSGNLNGVLLTASSVPTTALNTTAQSQLTTGNHFPVYIEVSPDFSTSRRVRIEGIVYGTGCTERKATDDGSATSNLGTITYDYRVITSTSWTTGVSFATLQSALNNASDATRIIEVRANTTGTVSGMVCLTIKRYL